MNLSTMLNHETDAQYLRNALNDVLTVLTGSEEDAEYRSGIASMIAEGALNGSWSRPDASCIMIDETNVEMVHRAFAPKEKPWRPTP